MQSQGTGQLLCQSPAKPEINKPAQIGMWISLIPFWHRWCGYGFWFGYIQTGPDDGTNPANQLICKLSPLFIYQGFIDPRWLALGFLNHQRSSGIIVGGHQGRPWLADPWSKSWRVLRMMMRHTKYLDSGFTLQGINISHLGKFGKSSTQNAIFGGYVSFLEGNVLKKHMM